MATRSIARLLIAVGILLLANFSLRLRCAFQFVLLESDQRHQDYGSIHLPMPQPAATGGVYLPNNGNHKVNGRPVSNMLPHDHLYVIYGLESSGTTFVTRAIAAALLGERKSLQGDSVESEDNAIHIQHISLPLGVMEESKQQSAPWSRTQKLQPELPIVPVFYPKECRVGRRTATTDVSVGKSYGMTPNLILPVGPNNNRQRPPSPVFQEVPPECHSLLPTNIVPSPPSRYFVNITSHVQWYRAQGVPHVTPIMVVRDPSFHFDGITGNRPGHCHGDPQAAIRQYQVGRYLMKESLQQLGNVVIVSYESLMTLQDSYWISQVCNVTNITTSYIPSFQDGNLLHHSHALFPRTFYTSLTRHLYPATNQTRLQRRKPHTTTMKNSGDRKKHPSVRKQRRKQERDRWVQQQRQRIAEGDLWEQQGHFHG